MDSDPMDGISTDSISDFAKLQQWALRRFSGLSPSHISDSFRIISMAGLAAPPGFKPVWRSMPIAANDAAMAHVLSGNVSALEAILLLLHPFKKHELQQVCMLLEALQDRFGGNGPPVFWIFHTADPELRISTEHLKVVKECGIEDFTKTEAAGFRLALDLRTMIAKTHHLANTMNELLARDQLMRQQKARLEALVRWTLWEYLTARTGDGAIPRLDRALPADIPQQLDGWTVGQYLGNGSCGSVVYLLTRPAVPYYRPDDSRRVLKAVSKSQYKTFVDVSGLQRSLEIMKQLSGTWQHPGISQLFRVYHSQTHILLSIEYCGSQSLFRRLQLREDPETQGGHLSPGKVRAIITQATAAIAHMHTGPEICHRDLKPENFMIYQEAGEEGLRLKLTDFSLAAWMATPCRTPCGSLPFVAPEVLLEKQYHGGPADVWSFSVVMLEVLCRTLILEHVLQLSLTPQGEGDREAIISEIARYFGAEGSASALLGGHSRHELAELVPIVAPVLEQTLQIDPVRRPDARQLAAAFNDLAM